MDLQFVATSVVPSVTQIANVLIEAAPNIAEFNIDTTSVSVEGLRKQS